MARLVIRYTILGTYMDPLADKLLVAAVLACRCVPAPDRPRLIIVGFIVIELALTAVYAQVLLQTRSARPANAFGKAKMIFQSVALYLFLLGGILELESWMTIGWILLWPALALAVVSGSKQVLGVWRATRNPQPPGEEAPPG